MEKIVLWNVEFLELGNAFGVEIIGVFKGLYMGRLPYGRRLTITKISILKRIEIRK